MDAATKFKLINELILAISQYLWPIVTLILVIVFRDDISALLRRVRKGKLFGQEMELDPEVEKFSEAVEQAQDEIPDSGVSEEQFKKEKNQLDVEVDEVLQAAKVNPELGIIRLSSFLEREIRIIAASLGVIQYSGRTTALNLFHIMVNKGYLPSHTTESLRLFWDLRNQIVHGHIPKDDRNVLKVLDIGLILLKTIKSIPHEINIVYRSGVDLYIDEECTQLVDNAKGLILETTSPGKATKFKRIFPITKPDYYIQGNKVTWEWDLSNIWNLTWYVDPDTDEKKKAWDSAGEFAGRHIEDAIGN